MGGINAGPTRHRLATESTELGHRGHGVIHQRFQTLKSGSVLSVSALCVLCDEIPDSHFGRLGSKPRFRGVAGSTAFLIMLVDGTSGPTSSIFWPLTHILPPPFTKNP